MGQIQSFEEMFGSFCLGWTGSTFLLNKKNTIADLG